MAVTQGGGIKDGKDLPDNALIEGEKTYIRQGDFFVDTVKLQEAGQSYSVEETVRERDLPDNAKIKNLQTGEVKTADNRFVKVGEKIYQCR